MTATDWNKFIGAGLGAVLLALGLSFLSELLYGSGGHGGSGDHPVMVAAHDAAAPASEAGEDEPEPVATEPIGVRLASADPAAGEKTFKKCSVCHSVEQDGPQKVGPNLYAVAGKSKAATDGFKYSDGLITLGGSWTYEELDQFLESPKELVPDTKMVFPGLKKPDQRADVIAYLLTHHDSPPPLPGE